jgi:hypothetical protein
MKKSSLRWLAATLLAATAFIQGGRAQVVRTAPPPPRTTAMYRAPHRGMVWTPGYYQWRTGRYRWVGGRWVYPPRPGAVWIQPVWRRGPGGYTFVAGRWR